MSAPIKPDFWNRKVKDISPFGLFQKAAWKTFATECRDYAVRYNRTNKGLMYLLFTLPAVGICSQYLAKNDYEKRFEYH